MLRLKWRSYSNRVKLQSAAAHAQSAHVCGLSGIFSDAHVARKND